MVETRTFQRGAKRHTDAVGRYVKAFLAENSGLSNEHGRKWSLRLCADVLGVPVTTLHRWVGKVAEADDGVPYKEQPSSAKVRESTTRSVLSKPEERREVIAALPDEVRDELRSELIEMDLPGSTSCRHCAAHCPKGGH
jgi:hypothetical protein